MSNSGLPYEVNGTISILIESRCVKSVSSKFNKKLFVNSLIKDDFEKFIKNVYESREIKVNLRRNLEIKALQ